MSDMSNTVNITGKGMFIENAVLSIIFYSIDELQNKLLTPQGFFQFFWEKAPGQSWEKMIDLTSKLGETITRVAKYIL